MRRMVVIALAAGALLAIGPLEARAQTGGGGSFRGYLTGHIGPVVGSDLDGATLSGGASVSVQENDGWGAELDFGHASDAKTNRPLLDITSYIVNAAWVKPVGFVRPFAAFGAGVLQVDGCASPCASSPRTYDFGMSVGGGAFVVLNEYVGFRGDARYFFSSADHPDLGRPNNLSYWRMTVGATFMWAILP